MREMLDTEGPYLLEVIAPHPVHCVLTLLPCLLHCLLLSLSLKT
jgi:hypothetical protein